MVRRLLVSLGSSVGLLVGAGCFHLSRPTPPVMQYALAGASLTPAVGASPSTPPLPPPSGKGFTIGLRRADVAAYLAVPDIIVRRGTHRIETSEFQRWSEPLVESINRVVAATLVRSGGVRAVDIAPWPALAAHDLLVQLHVARFEGIAAEGASTGEAHIDIAWDIVQPRTGKLLVRGTTQQRGVATWKLDDYGGLVRALETGLDAVGREIGRCIGAFPNDSTPPASCGSRVGAR